jgi:FKBP-type peptidyl-prolyl cis-trans isomerase SlpA
MSNTTPVGPGTKVTLNFSLKLATGEVVDSTSDKPATFFVGDGSLLPGFEKVMFGMSEGGKEEFAVPAEQGFGEVNPENVHMLKRLEFSPDLELTEGLVVSFSDSEGQQLPGVVTRLFDEIVEVDFNHPLAGKDLLFEVEIIAVEQVSDEIARM